jgi:hypothetical protein
MGMACKHMGEMTNTYTISVGNLTGRDHLEDLGVETWIMLKWILKKYRFMRLSIATNGGLLATIGLEKIARNFLTIERLSASQEKLCFMIS